MIFAFAFARNTLTHFVIAPNIARKPSVRRTENDLSSVTPWRVTTVTRRMCTDAQ